MRIHLLALATCSLFASGCGDDGLDDLFDDVPAAPSCTDTFGCPEGTRCVGGMRCELLPGAELPMSPPLLRPSPPRLAPPRPRRPPQLDAGFDAGQDAAVRRDAGRDGARPFDECGGGRVLCLNLCVDLRIDPNNCGGCGVACPDAQTCNLGVCCDSIRTVCGGRCVDTFSDRDNCGVCDLQCELDADCVLGLCVPADPFDPGPVF